LDVVASHEVAKQSPDWLWIASSLLLLTMTFDKGINYDGKSIGRNYYRRKDERG
jgi:hypothetical protein